MEDQINPDQAAPRFTKRQVTIVSVVSATLAAVAAVVIRSKVQPLLACEGEVIDLSV